MNTVDKKPRPAASSDAKTPSKPTTTPAGKSVVKSATNKTAAKTAVAAKKNAAPPAKTAVKPALKTPVKAAAKTVEKTEKTKKIKLVRDSFTVPKNELNVLNDLKLRALSLKVGIKKSELLRAGIKALAAMTDATFLTALQAVPALKTGRPKK